jgi:hypothetical protein
VKKQSTLIKSLSNLLLDIKKSKKKWKHSDKFEREVKQIINKLHLIAEKKTDFSSLKNNQLPPRLANDWLKNQAIEYFGLDPDDDFDIDDYSDDDFRINLGSKLKKYLTRSEEAVNLALYELEILVDKKNHINKSSQQIFISYAREDSKQANKMYNALRSVKGLDVWIDEENLLPGMIWEDSIYDAIDQSDFVILILSSKSVEKTGFFQKEIRIFLERLLKFPPGKIFLIPVRIEECNIKHRELLKIHIVDMFPNWESGFKKVIQAIKAEIKSNR